MRSSTSARVYTACFLKSENGIQVGQCFTAPGNGQLKFRNSSKSSGRTNRNEVNQERTWSSNVYSVTRRLVTVDDERVRDALHLIPICDVQYNPAN